MAGPVKILAGAQAFGYGPSAKLVTVASQLKARGMSLHFWGNGIAESFARLNAPVYDAILNQDLAAVEDGGYAAVLSAMDPLIAAWGHAHGAPVLAIDSLYWLWEWPEAGRAAVHQTLKELTGPEHLPSLIRYIESLPGHLQQYVTHLTAALSFIQRYPGECRGDGAEAGLRLVEVSPIVDLQYRREGLRDMVLISFAGMINPLIAPEDTLGYFQLVRELLEPALPIIESRAQAVICAVNPQFVETARHILPGVVKPLSHAEMLTTMSRAAAVLAPPGMTTIFEAAAYGAPALLLPEQNYGQPPYHRRLASSAREPHRFRETFPDAMISYRLPQHFADRTQHTRALYQLYNRLLAGEMPEASADMSRTLCEPLVKLVSEPQARETRAQAQRDMIAQLTGDFSGGDQIVQAIVSFLSRIESHD